MRKSVFASVVICFAATVHAQDDSLFAVNSSNFPGSDFGLVDVVNSEFELIGSTSVERLTGLEINSEGRLFAVSCPFFADELAEVFELDPATGLAISSVEISQRDVKGLAFSPNDDLYGVNLNSTLESVIIVINPITGETNEVGPIGFTPSCISALEFGNDGNLYAFQSDSQCNQSNGRGLLRIDLTTGEGIDVNPAVGGQGITSLAMGLAANGQMYLTSSEGSNGRLFSVNLTDGTIEEISPNLFDDQPFGLTGVAPILLGDVNCDGGVDLLDVAPFVDSVTTGKFNSKADTNFDGAVDLLDVVPFVELLAGN